MTTPAVVVDEDSEWVARACLGDRSAFGELVQRHQRRLRSMLTRYVGNAEDAEDLAQEAFLAAYRALPGFRGQSRFRTWLYTIAVHEARSFLLARSKTATLSLDEWLADDEHDPDRPSGTFSVPEALKQHETPEDVFAQRQTAQALTQALQTLDDEHREIIMLREMDGLSYQEIGTMLDLPPGTVRSRLFRARERLAERMRSSSAATDTMTSSSPATPPFPGTHDA